MGELTDLDTSAAAKGDEAAMRRVYEVLAPALLGYVRSRGSEDPEGLTQEVFVALVPRIPKVHGGAKGLRTLAFSIAHARLVDELRRRDRRPTTSPFEVHDDPRSSSSAEEEALSHIQSVDAIALLASLGEDQRAVVALRVVAQLSLEETAEVVGRSIGAVKQLQRRGLLALRSRLHEQGTVTREP